MPLHPTIKWSQDDLHLLLKIECSQFVPPLTTKEALDNFRASFSKGTFNFKLPHKDKVYEFTLELHDADVVSMGVGYDVLGFQSTFVAIFKKNKPGMWPRLQKPEIKNHPLIKLDFDVQDFDDDEDRFAARAKAATTEAVGKFSELLKEGKLFDKEGNFL